MKNIFDTIQILVYLVHIEGDLNFYLYTYII